MAAPFLYQQIATTTNTYFADKNVSSNFAYAYQVKSVDSKGTVSGPSNYVSYPAVTPPTTFSLVWDMVMQFAASGKFKTPAAQQQISKLLTIAEAAAKQKDFSALLTLIQNIEGQGNQFSSNFDEQDFLILLGRLFTRAQLVLGNLLPVGALQ